MKRVLAGFKRWTHKFLQRLGFRVHQQHCLPQNVGKYCMSLCMPFQWWPRQSIALLDPSSRFDSGDTHLLQQSRKKHVKQGTKSNAEGAQTHKPKSKSMIQPPCPVLRNYPKRSMCNKRFRMGRLVGSLS